MERTHALLTHRDSHAITIFHPNRRPFANAGAGGGGGGGGSTSGKALGYNRRGCYRREREPKCREMRAYLADSETDMLPHVPDH